MNRFSNALFIQEGACNPSGVVRTLVQAIDEARAENPDTDSVSRDPAVMLIVHQLAWICHIGEIDFDPSAYTRLMNACRDKADRIPQAVLS
jgi:hypothetical protein